MFNLHLKLYLGFFPHIHLKEASWQLYFAVNSVLNSYSALATEMQIKYKVFYYAIFICFIFIKIFVGLTHVQCKILQFLAKKTAN